MNKNTFAWYCSLGIAAAYLCFGLPLIAQIGIGEFTIWGIILGLILGLSPLFGLWSSSSVTTQVRVGVSLVLALVNIMAAALIIFGTVGVLDFTLPSAIDEIFGITMILVSLIAFTVNTVMFVKVMTNASIIDKETI